MKKIVLLILILVTNKLLADIDLYQVAKPIVEEGKILYQLEMSSWYGTDLFLENYKLKENVGGYFSYLDEVNGSKCVFFSKGDTPIILGTITFDKTINSKTAKVDLSERRLTFLENDYYQLRKFAMERVFKDTLFKQYKNTSFNFVPLINKRIRKVLIFTNTNKDGVVIFGNDYSI